jgi:hypothetical protein
MNNENGYYYDPLGVEANFPNIWLLAQHILSIPATSVPSGRVFSAAANITDKKRAHITTDNLMFYGEITSSISWIFHIESLGLGGLRVFAV